MFRKQPCASAVASPFPSLDINSVVGPSHATEDGDVLIEGIHSFQAGRTATDFESS